MNIDDLTLRQIKEISALFPAQSVTTNLPPAFANPVVAQFIGRFVFVCDLYIEGDYCHLKKVRNVRYWAARDNGLGGLAKNGQTSDDIIDEWPDQIIPLDKLGAVMCANPEHWS